MKVLARKHLRDMIALAGFAWVVAGVWQVYAPAGMVVLGVGLLWAGWHMSDVVAPSEEP